MGMGAKAYRARLARSSGLPCKRPFESAFGKKILQKYGWKEGEGLGRRKQGKTASIQAVRRDLKVGLGHEKDKSEDQWDNWWANCFNSVAKKVKVSHPTSSVPQKNGVDDSDDSSDESSNEGGHITAVKKASV